MRFGGFQLAAWQERFQSQAVEMQATRTELAVLESEVILTSVLEKCVLCLWMLLGLSYWLGMFPLSVIADATSRKFTSVRIELR